jgi:predicted naringenin-chalcone synthase
MTEATQPLPLPANVLPSVAPSRVCGLALATPPVAYTQEQALALLGLADDPFAQEVFGRCGVRRRHLELAPDTVWTTMQSRTVATEERLLSLAVRAIDQLELDPAEVGVVVSATYWSIGGPTLAHRIVDRYGLDADTDKYHLVGIGCASAVPLLRLADQALRDRPGEKALVVAAESVSGFMTAAMPGDARVKVVGSSLFGDGCAAALLAREDDAPGPAIVATAVHQVPDTLDYVRFNVSSGDSHMEIARELPSIARERLAGLVDEFLGARGLTTAAIDHWVVHPGGRGILEGVQAGLGLSDEQVASSAHVLAEFGNVGTPSAFFVLADTLERHRPQPGDHGLAVTIGPGVTVGLMLLRW